ncbi:T7SS effector LXG polymorphic toxin [Listeria kieliensis]
MSINMFLGDADQQAESIGRQCRAYQEGFEEIKTAIAQFVLEDSLKGKTYDSAKHYLNATFTPLANGIILICEALEKAAKKFPKNYRSNVDQISLQEDVLRHQMNRLDDLVQTTEHLENTLKATPAAPLLRLFAATLEDSKRVIKKQLDKLLAFDPASGQLFADVENLMDAVERGLKEVHSGKAFQASTGTFSIIGLNMDWVKPIQQKWDKREAERAEQQQDTIEIKEIKSRYGTFYQVLLNGEVDHEETKRLAEELAKQDLKSIEAFLAGAGIAVIENNGVKAMLDGIFGERTVNASLQNENSYQAGALTGNIISLAQAGLEYIGGGLWGLGTSAASIAGAPVTGGASLSGIPALGIAGTAAIWGHATAVGGMAVQNIMGGSGNHDANNGAVKNMDEFFESEFGSELKGSVEKTSKRVDGQQVYKLKKNMKSYKLKKGDQIYLDGLHKDHLEVFNSNGELKTVLNLNGSVNEIKLIKAKGRKLK